MYSVSPFECQAHIRSCYTKLSLRGVGDTDTLLTAILVAPDNHGLL